jgi:hypothetical protein
VPEKKDIKKPALNSFDAGFLPLIKKYSSPYVYLKYSYR